MRTEKRKKIIGLLGVGFDADDGHVRITQGANHDVFMGSEESHEYLQKLIGKIEDGLKENGLALEDMTPESFSEFVASLK